MLNQPQALKLLRKYQAEHHFIDFVRQAWPVLEPGTPLVEGPVLTILCTHLEAVAYGVMQRLLINVPPGSTKSLLTDVFFPAWVWGPLGRHTARFMCASYSQSLTVRDNEKCLRLLESAWFQENWPIAFNPRVKGVEKFATVEGGFKLATSAGGVGTGERADYVLVDDPHNVIEAESAIVRENVVRWFREALSDRLNDINKSAIVVIMQRVHELDVSGVILSEGLGYEHICLPMEYEGGECETSLGKIEWRTEPGELLWPERFPQEALERIKHNKGPYAYAAQYQQAPAPRGGGIIQRDWWKQWGDDDPENATYPLMSYVVASFDGADTAREQNDPSACSVWGIFNETVGDTHLVEVPRAIMLYAWADRLPLHERVEKLTKTCERFRVDRLLIEAKSCGYSVAQEMARLYSRQDFIVEMVNPGIGKGSGDKVARAHAVVPLFANGCVYAPNTRWAKMVQDQCAVFPKGAHDDLVDTVTQALRHFRNAGLLQTESEAAADDEAENAYHRPFEPLYPV